MSRAPSGDANTRKTRDQLEESWRRDLARHVFSFARVTDFFGGTEEFLRRALDERNLTSYVSEVLRGDFHTSVRPRPFSLIYGDVTHDEAEIDLHVPKIVKDFAEDALCAYGLLSFPTGRDVQSKKYAALILISWIMVSKESLPC